MRTSNTESTIWSDDLGTHTHRITFDKPSTFKNDWKGFGVLQKIAACVAIAALILVALAIVAGIYLLVGWGLVAALAFITGGAIALNALQGALIVVILAFVANMFRRR